MSTPRVMLSRASRENLTSLADMIGTFGWKRGEGNGAGRSARERACGSGDHAEHVTFLHDEEVLAVQLYLGPGPFAEQDLVAGLEIQRRDRAAFVTGAGADGDDLAFLGLFLDGVGDDDSAGGLLGGFDPADEHPVVQGTKGHMCFPVAGPRRLVALTSRKPALPICGLALKLGECQSAGCGTFA